MTRFRTNLEKLAVTLMLMLGNMLIGTHVASGDPIVSTTNCGNDGCTLEELINNAGARITIDNIAIGGSVGSVVFSVFSGTTQFVPGPRGIDPTPDLSFIDVVPDVVGKQAQLRYDVFGALDSFTFASPYRQTTTLNLSYVVTAIGLEVFETTLRLDSFSFTGSEGIVEICEPDCTAPAIRVFSNEDTRTENLLDMQAFAGGTVATLIRTDDLDLETGVVLDQFTQGYSLRAPAALPTVFLMLDDDTLDNGTNCSDVNLLPVNEGGTCSSIEECAFFSCEGAADYPIENDPSFLVNDDAASIPGAGGNCPNVLRINTLTPEALPLWLPTGEIGDEGVFSPAANGESPVERRARWERFPPCRPLRRMDTYSRTDETTCHFGLPRICGGPATYPISQLCDEIDLWI